MIIFWTSFLLLFYTYIGYPLVIWVISKCFPQPTEKGDILPNVSIVIAAYNEERYIARKILNCLELDYPKDKLEIFIGSDCSTDKTDEIIESYIPHGVRYIRFSERCGKISILNKIIPNASGEIIILADARQSFDRQAVKELVKNFIDEKVGCVSGELILVENDVNNLAKGLGFYWNYEKFIRKSESKVSSTIGATGAIYAIRKKLFIAQESDIILDDVFIPLAIVANGSRATFESSAIAYDKITQTSNDELKRKIRTIAGNWQLISKIKICSFISQPIIIFQLISHKFMRLIAPYFILALLFSNIILIKIKYYQLILILQIIFYTFASLNILLKKYKLKIISIPYTFCALNFYTIIGFYFYIRNKQKVTWK